MRDEPKDTYGEGTRVCNRPTTLQNAAKPCDCEVCIDGEWVCGGQPGACEHQGKGLFSGKEFANRVAALGALVKAAKEDG